eukprot:3697048-Amphidinium_carterae.1
MWSRLSALQELLVSQVLGRLCAHVVHNEALYHTCLGHMDNTESGVEKIDNVHTTRGEEAACKARSERLLYSRNGTSHAHPVLLQPSFCTWGG